MLLPRKFCCLAIKHHSLPFNKQPLKRFENFICVHVLIKGFTFFQKIQKALFTFSRFIYNKLNINKYIYTSQEVSQNKLCKVECDRYKILPNQEYLTS